MFRQSIANNAAMLRVCLVKGILAAGDYGLISWVPTLLQRSYGYSRLGLAAVGASRQRR